MERVKQALRKGEVCSFADLYNNFLSNGRNDISRLKREGWYIETTWTKHAGSGPAHCHYKLIKESGDSVLGAASPQW
jgi:hypothetical protein